MTPTCTEEEKLTPADHGMTGLIEDEAQEADASKVVDHTVSISEDQEPQPADPAEEDAAKK